MFDGLTSTDVELMLMRYCEYCSKPLTEIPPNAANKRFCSAECRNGWHYLNRTKLRRARKRELRGDFVSHTNPVGGTNA